MNKIIFKEHIEEYFLYTFPENNILIMDNCKAHKNALDEKLLEEHKVNIKYLPQYSPDLNPIENMWSKIKDELRKKQSRDKWELWGKVDLVRKNVTEENALGWFRGCEYFIKEML